MKKLGKTGNIVPRTLRRDNQLHTVIVQSIMKHGRVSGKSSERETIILPSFDCIYDKMLEN